MRELERESTEQHLTGYLSLCTIETTETYRRSYVNFGRFQVHFFVPSPNRRFVSDCTDVGVGCENDVRRLSMRDSVP